MQKKRSTVWRLFQETGDNKVACRTCHKRLTKHGNTSMMLRHIRGKHPELARTLADYEGANAAGEGHSTWKEELFEEMESQMQEPVIKRKRSTVWRHFAEEGHGKVSCRICHEKLVKHGNTSSMLRHLRGKHPQLKLGELQGERNYSRLQLRANNTESRFLAVCERLLQHNHLTDVTLMAEGQFVQAHRLVLATCSDSFEELFKTVTHANPVIVLRDISMQELRGILSYMYKGETLVKSHELPGLLRAAATLRIRGLSQVGLRDSLIDPPRAGVQHSRINRGASMASSMFNNPDLDELEEEDEEDDLLPHMEQGPKLENSFEMNNMTSDNVNSEDSPTMPIPAVQIKVETGLSVKENVDDQGMDELEAAMSESLTPEVHLNEAAGSDELGGAGVLLPSEDEVVVHEEALDDPPHPGDGLLDNIKQEIFDMEEEDSTSHFYSPPAKTPSPAPDTSRRCRNYEKQDLVTALNLVRDSHLGLKPAARAFNIPISTLLNAMKKQRGGGSGRRGRGRRGAHL